MFHILTFPCIFILVLVCCFSVVALPVVPVAVPHSKSLVYNNAVLWCLGLLWFQFILEYGMFFWPKKINLYETRLVRVYFFASQHCHSAFYRSTLYYAIPVAGNWLPYILCIVYTCVIFCDSKLTQIKF